MQFKVRDGFNVTQKEVVETDNGQGTTTKELVETRVNAGKTAEFTEAQALASLHALEPVDKEARAFVAKFMLDHNRADADQPAAAA